jgi:hypothetical protein
MQGKEMANLNTSSTKVEVHPGITARMQKLDMQTGSDPYFGSKPFTRSKH